VPLRCSYVNYNYSPSVDHQVDDNNKKSKKKNKNNKGCLFVSGISPKIKLKTKRGKSRRYGALAFIHILF
jgi:hypothetical protein